MSRKIIGVIIIAFIVISILVFNHNQKQESEHYRSVFVTIDNAYQNNKVLSEKQMNNFENYTKGKPALQTFFHIYQSKYWHLTGEDSGTPIALKNVRDQFYKKYRNEILKSLN